MRVIAGMLKGRRLSTPSWEGLRPTSDKLRETLFNILAPRIAGARVLDGYAGTGAVGIEALSRGAVSVTFVDNDRRAQALIEENLARCGIAEGYAIIRASVDRALGSLREDAHEPFDLVLLDPPYERRSGGRLDPGDPGNIDAVLAAVSDVLAPGGVVVLEHARRWAAPDTAGSLVRTREVTSGDSALALFAVK
jgi:16S rRNA (guanine(966)-N(2))-methyltransferase RsmD